MPFQYAWKETKGGGRRYTRTFVPDVPVKAVKAAPVEPVAEAVTQFAIGTLPTVNEQFDAAEIVAEAPKPKRGRPRKVQTDGS